MGNQHGEINTTRLLLLFVLFLVALYFYMGQDTTSTFSEYEQEKYWSQKSCLDNSDCIEGYYCDQEKLFCEPVIKD